MSLSRPRRGREEEEDDRDALGENQRGSTPAKRPRPCSCSCFQETKDFYEVQIEILKKEMQCLSKGFNEERKALQREMQEFYQNSQLQLSEKINEQQQRMEQFYHNNSRLILEQFSTLISDTNIPGGHVQKYSSHGVLSNQSKTRTYRLKFENKCCSDKYSRHDITADDGNPIKIAIYDHENHIISNGPLSSIQVQIVVLDGEFNKDNKDQWSGDSFRGSIIHARPGKPPLFSNELYLRLENGVAILYSAKFQDNSSFVPSKKFRLGVIATDDNISEQVLEGISESFAVKDGRGYLAKKDPYPSPSDPIYKLKKIAVNGDRRRLLENMNIKQVQDFIRLYKKDKNALRKACENIPEHDWNVIVGHALSCKPGPECYSYCIPEMNATILFNSLYDIVGAEFSGKYTSCEKLSDTQKRLVEAAKIKAYDNLKVVQYTDKDPCHEHEVISQDKGTCYLRGSCSIISLPTEFQDEHNQGPVVIISDEHSHHNEVLGNVPAQGSPRPCQRWVKVVSVVKTLHYWNKERVESASFREMISTLLEEIPTV